MFATKTVKAAFCAIVLSLGLATATPLANDGQDQTGLVNVSIGDITTGDILSNNRVTVGVAANTAANVCGIQLQAGVLAAFLDQNGSFKCSNQQTLQFAQVTK